MKTSTRHKEYIVHSVLPVLYRVGIGGRCEKRNVHRELYLVRMMYRIGDVGYILFLKTVVTVVPQQVRYALTLILKTLDTERHSLLEQRRCRIGNKHPFKFLVFGNKIHL